MTTFTQRPAGPGATTRLLRLLALLLAFSLVAAACGGGDDGGGGGGAPADDEPAEEGEPRPGGSMVIGVEAEVDGFDPTKNRMPVSGLTYANAIYDPIATFDADNQPVPYLAESIEPNEDHTTWTITMRDGVQFHDGEPVTADAVIRGLEAHRASPLTGPAIAEIESIEKVDERTFEIHLESSWVIFPSVLTGQIGFVMAPAMLDDPGASRSPIGTGPFRFQDWEPGSRLRLVKNENYWPADEGLPYLDEVEFRPILEPQSRTDALLSGEVDLIHTTAGESINQLRDAGDQVQLHELGEGAAEEAMLLLNTATPPFDNVHARRAASLAIEREQYVEVIDQGVTSPADSPFSGQSDLPEPDGGFQRFDPEEARAEVEAYEADTGQELAFEFSHTNNTVSQRAGQLLQGMWADVGIEVSLKAVEPSQFTQDAIMGSFQASLWRQHGAPQPDMEFVWWNIDNANEVGTPSLNFGRYRDEDLQAILEGARGVSDAAERARMYGDVVQIFADEVPFVYLTRTQMVYAYAPNVGGIRNSIPLPDGAGPTAVSPVAGLIRAGGLYFTDEP